MRLRSVLVLFVLSATQSLAAQFKAQRVLFLNTGEYPQADLLRLQSLRPGQRFSQGDLQAAATQLADTGYFDDVQAKLDGPATSIDVQFTVAPTAASKLFRPTYKNFVLLSAADILALTKSMPLLSFGIPEGGNQQAAVQAALKQLLAAKSVDADVAYSVIPPSTDHPQGLEEFRVDSPQVRVGTVNLDGVSTAMSQDVQTALRRTQGSLFNEGEAGLSTRERLLLPWLNAGYMDVRLDSFERVVEAVPNMNRVLVDVRGAVNAGEPYRVTAINFAGTPIESAQQFAKTARIHVGGLASRQDLLLSIAPVTEAYRSQGYMDAVITAVPTKNPSTHQVEYTINVVPGVPYRLHSITIDGLPPELKTQVESVFKLRVGDVYDEPYVRSFLTRNKTLPALDHYSAKFASSADPQTQLLDLVITFLAAKSVEEQ